MNGITQLFDKIEKQGQENVPANAILKADGLLYCSSCDTPIQCKQVLLGKEYLMPCLCSCELEKRDHTEREFKKRLKIEEIKRRRSTLLTLPKYHDMTFEKSDTTKKFTTNYVTNFEKYKTENLGLLLWGNRGTGKTFDAACIANALIDKGYSAFMATINHMTENLGKFEHRAEFKQHIIRFDLVIIDDFGTDRGSDYTHELIYNIIDIRACSCKPMIITTNLSPKEMADCEDLKSARIYDRILECCHPIAYDGASRRIETGRKRFKGIEKELNA